MKYQCQICKKIFLKKYNYEIHINRKIPCIIKEDHKEVAININDIIKGSNVSQAFPSVSQGSNIGFQAFPSVSCKYECLICHNNYVTRSGLFKHKKRDHINYEEDIKCINDEINKNILNEVNIQNDSILNQELLTTKEKLNSTEKKLDIILDTLSVKQKDVIQQKIINSNNNSHNTNTNTNLVVNVKNVFTDFGFENLNHLTLEDRREICSHPSEAVNKIIQKVHLNKNSKLDMNIYLTNLRSNVMFIIENNKFVARNKNETMYDVLHVAGIWIRELCKNEENTKGLLDSQKDSLEILHDFLTRYDFDNEDFDGNIVRPAQALTDKYNKIKLGVELILYNNRDVVLANYNKLMDENQLVCVT
jgi:hypothetical protein